MVAPMKYAERTALGQPLIEEDHDLLVDMYRGFTPAGTFVSNYTYIVSTDGVDCYASSAYQTIFGGPTDIGGVDGGDPAAVMQACLDALVSGGVIMIHGEIDCAGTGLTVDFSDITICGAGYSDKLIFNGVTGITVAQDINYFSMHDLTLEEDSYGRTQTAILFNGATAGHDIESCSMTNVHIFGWDTAIYGKYLWSSSFVCVDTLYSLTGLHIFGQSVNNNFVNCSFQYYQPGGAPAQECVIVERNDGPDESPESCNFSNCLIYGGTIGIYFRYAWFSKVE